MIEFFLASSNAQKCKEFEEMAPNLTIRTLDDFDAVEDGKSYEENAKIKVLTLQSLLRKKGLDTSKYVLFSDDSGLEIASMPNELGLHTARFMGNIPQTEKNKAIVERLKGKSDKSAFFICTICFIALDSAPRFLTGRVDGRINDKVLGLKGFGYDPVFIPNGYDKTYSELGDEFKNISSHRAIAFHSMLNILKKEGVI